MDERKENSPETGEFKTNKEITPSVDAGFGHIGHTYAKVEEPRDICPQTPENLLWFRKPEELGWDRIVELIFAAAIVGFSYLAYLNSESTSRQTDELIRAAGISAYSSQQNLNAARDFSNSARHINEGISDAVDRLKLQAEGTEILADQAAIQARNIEAARKSSVDESEKTLETTIRNSQSEARAYLVSDLNGIESGCPPNNFPMPCGKFNVTNLGRTPALFVKYEARIHWDDPNGGTVNGGEDLRKMVAEGRDASSDGGSLGANEKSEFEAHAVNPVHKCTETYHGAPCRYSIYGTISYKDIFGVTHETGFCASYAKPPILPPASCAGGNWFDVRPIDYPQVVQK